MLSALEYILEDPTETKWTQQGPIVQGAVHTHSEIWSLELTVQIDKDWEGERRRNDLPKMIESELGLEQRLLAA